MNIERLKHIVDGLLKDEKELNIQSQLTDLNAALTNFVGSPSDPNHQIEVSNKLNSLAGQVNALIARYDPAQIKMLDSIGALRFFSNTMIQEIQKSIAENTLTPAVVQTYVNKLQKQRATYLQNLQSLANNFEALGISADNLKEGEAEIGFLIPRELFHNNLEGLIQELEAIEFIIRAFSELSTGSVESIIVKQISTTNPLFFFGLKPKTIAMLAGAVTWALATWKLAEEIRNLRAETEKTQQFTEQEIKGFYDKKVTDIVKQAIDKKVAELLAEPEGKINRKGEQSTHLTKALESILARVERGMTVEIRFLPPQKDESASIESPQNLPEFVTLQTLTPQLLFPPASPKPILNLPPPDDKK